MKQLWKVARMILSERLTSKAAMCMGHFEPGEEPNKLHECPWASKQLVAEEVPTFVGGKCTCAEKGGCCGGVANDNYEPKKGEGFGTGLLKPEDVDKEHQQQQSAAKSPRGKQGWFW